MQPLVSREFAALVQRCSCAPCAALRSALGAPAVRIAHARELRDRLGPLSHADKRLLGLVGLGYSNRKISGRLRLTEEVVKRRLYGLFAKIGVRSRTAAALRASELGLVPYQDQAERAAAPLPPNVVTLLTAEERRTLGLVGQGLSNKEIGRALHLAESTVKNRLSAIFRKLGVPDRTQAALLAVRLGLVRVEVGRRPTRRTLQTSV
jgi:DNA-binding NarL/FixJ family response regulator